MLQSNTSLSGRSSDSWDTCYARKFLLIPKDELKLFEKPTPQQKISQRHSSEDKLVGQITEEPSIARLLNPENADQLHASIETSNIKVAVVHTSDLIQKKRSELSLTTEKNLSLDSVSLCRKRTIEVTSVIPEKKFSSSAPGVQTLEGISFNMSTEHETFSKSDTFQQLNTTYIVPTVLDDKTNNIQTISDEPCIAKKKSSEMLANQISNQSILDEPSSPIGPKFGGLPVFSTNPVQKPVDRGNFLTKKLKLLEKRFSPSKEFSLVPPSEENLKPKCILKNDGIQIMTTSIAVSDDILVSQVNASSPNEVYDKEINSPKAASKIDSERATSTFSYTQSPEKAMSMQKDLLGEMQPSPKKCTDKIPLKPNTSVFEEESFISQPFPCGQPPSNTQISAKSVPSRPETQLSIESQGAASMIKENLAEKANMPSNVFYDKCSGQVEVNDMVPVKDKTGGKRKRKSKSDKPSKRIQNTKSLICIQYTGKQVQDMIEIIKNFQFKEKTNI